MADLDGQIAFVTGAGSGLGREIALSFARAGARVAVNDLRVAAAAAVHEELAVPGAAGSCGPPGGRVSGSARLPRGVARQGIVVNAIARGYIDTPLLDVMGDQRAMQTAMIALQTAVGRLGEAREIAATALFLAGPGASYFTGQVLSPNGGLVI